MTPRLRSLASVALALTLLLPGCITFQDREGIIVSPEALARVERGVTTRSELLATLGPPTGVFRVRPFDAITRQGAFSSSLTQARLDEDVLVWQEVTIDGSILMLPVLALMADTDVWSRTIMVVLDDDVVVHVGVREDEP